MDEAINRRRIEARRGEFSAAGDRAGASVFKVGKLVSVPTAVPRIFLGNRRLDDVDGEPAYSADLVPVLVLGPRVPSEGQEVLAHFTAGQWVANHFPAGSPSTWPCRCQIDLSKSVFADLRTWKRDYSDLVFPTPADYVLDSIFGIELHPTDRRLNTDGSACSLGFTPCVQALNPPPPSTYFVSNWFEINSACGPVLIGYKSCLESDGWAPDPTPFRLFLKCFRTTNLGPLLNLYVQTYADQFTLNGGGDGCDRLRTCTAIGFSTGVRCNPLDSDWYAGPQPFRDRATQPLPACYDNGVFDCGFWQARIYQ